MIAVELFQERRCVVVRPVEQMPDVTDHYRDTLRPRLVAITYAWTRADLRGTKASAHGEVDVELSGDRVKDGEPQKWPSTTHLAWRDRAKWPGWVTELVAQLQPPEWTD